MKDLTPSEHIEHVERAARNYSKGNRMFITIGFVIVGAIDGFSHFQSSSDRSVVTVGLDKVWEQVSAMHTDVTELKTFIAEQTKHDKEFDDQVLKLEDRVTHDEIEAARHEGGGHPIAPAAGGGG
jgi:hypothetical protein